MLPQGAFFHWYPIYWFDLAVFCGVRTVAFLFGVSAARNWAENVLRKKNCKLTGVAIVVVRNRDVLVSLSLAAADVVGVCSAASSATAAKFQ